VSGPGRRNRLPHHGKHVICFAGAGGFACELQFFRTMTVGFFAPLPPARTGVADYAAALLAELRCQGTVQLAPARCDVPLYHLGNNGLHAEIYQRALAHPGVIVLHDAVLHHFLLGQLGETAYVEEFVYNYGEWNRGLARELWRARAASGADARYFRWPMLRRAAERARAVIVHNPAAARAVTEHAPHARVFEIPHLFQRPVLPSEAEALRFRQRLGVSPDTFLFGVFGYFRESKRLYAVLETFHALHREIPRTALLVAGQFVSTDLARAVEPLLSAPGTLRLPYMKESEFLLAARAVNAAINLRDPPAGETSGIAVRLMGIGKPVLLTDGPEYARLPEDACLRIPAGVAERDSLWHHMVLLTSNPGVASAIGQRGAGHIRAHHRLPRIGRHYWKVLCESCV
jgi:glycosyltransferase involved in cell wall biosynthesis